MIIITYTLRGTYKDQKRTTVNINMPDIYENEQEAKEHMEGIVEIIFKKAEWGQLTMYEEIKYNTETKKKEYTCKKIKEWEK